jgi:hypothetical protein
MQFVTYSITISVFFSEAYNLRRNKIKEKKEVEEEIYKRYFDVLSLLNVRLP